MKSNLFLSFVPSLVSLAHRVPRAEALHLALQTSVPRAKWLLLTPQLTAVPASGELVPSPPMGSLLYKAAPRALSQGGRVLWSSSSHLSSL